MKSFKLIGLNKPWKAAGFNSIYATVESGKEDWFHSSFDSEIFPDEKLNNLFDIFKNSDENLWKGKNHEVIVEWNDGTPVIKKLVLDIIVANNV